MCKAIAKEKQEVTVYMEKKRYGKAVTMISGIDPKAVNLKDLAKKLKTTIACGGTIKHNIIELQGDHRERAKELLIEAGFQEDSITVK